MFCFLFFSSRWKETLFNPEGKTGPYCTGHFLSQISLAIANFKLTHHSGGCRSGRTMPRVPSTSQAVGPASSTGHWGGPRQGNKGVRRARAGLDLGRSVHIQRIPPHCFSGKATCTGSQQRNPSGRKPAWQSPGQRTCT